MMKHTLLYIAVSGMTYCVFFKGYINRCDLIGSRQRNGRCFFFHMQLKSVYR